MKAFIAIAIVLIVVAGLFAIIFRVSRTRIKSITKSRHPDLLAASFSGVASPAVVGVVLVPFYLDDVQSVLGIGLEEPTSQVTASRGFAGPNQYPPEQFAAYGILVFRSRATSFDRSRHTMICEAYIGNLVHWSELAVPPNEQMVTIWPVDSDSVADSLNEAPRNIEVLCGRAVDHYGLVAAQQSLIDATYSGVDRIGEGPFLFAWAPATDKGKKNTIVLISDLSDVTTFDQANYRIQDWVQRIQKNPSLWQAGSGWNLELLQTELRLWFDKYGPMALAIFGGE